MKDVNGLGDLIEVAIDRLGSLVGHSFKKTTCGCARRKNALNRILAWSPVNTPVVGKLGGPKAVIQRQLGPDELPSRGPPTRSIFDDN